MSERDVLNAALAPYKVNMNTVTPLIDKVVAEEGGSGSSVLTVHVVGEEGVYEYTADVPIVTIWEKANAEQLVIVEFKEAPSSEWKKCYLGQFYPDGEGYEKSLIFCDPIEEELVQCYIDTDSQPPCDRWCSGG